jgi:hypothetical protein
LRRCGELLKQFDSRPTNNPSGIKTTQTDMKDSLGCSQKQMAEQSGLTEKQQVTAVRVANVPESTFEKLVESELTIFNLFFLFFFFF